METKREIILICDDEEGVRESFKLILSDNFELQFAHNGDEALSVFKKMTLDLVFLDMKMPKMHGMDILKEIKKAKPLLPVIIVTGYQSGELVQEALKNGATDYVPKPFDSKLIKTAVNKALNRTEIIK